MHIRRKMLVTLCLTTCSFIFNVILILDKLCLILKQHDKNSSHLWFYPNEDAVNNWKEDNFDVMLWLCGFKPTEANLLCR